MAEENPILARARAENENPILAAAQRERKAAPHHEVATGFDKQPKRTNPLRTAAEYLAAPISLLGAAYESIPNPTLLGHTIAINAPTHPTGNHLARAYHILRTEGPRELNEQYGVASDATLQREGIAPANVPTPLRVGAELAAQWWNPVNPLVGRAVGLAGKGLSAARRASPALDEALTPYEELGRDLARPVGKAVGAVTRPIGNAARAVTHKALDTAARLPGVGTATAGMRALLSRYAGLRERGGTPYVAGGVAAAAAPQHAEATVVRDTRDFFGGLTRAQKIEVQKMSYLDKDGQHLAQRDPNVPEPKRGLPLAERGKLVRASKMLRDVRLNELGIRSVDKGEQYDTLTHFPMRRFAGQPVYNQPEAEAALEHGDELGAVAAIEKAARRRSQFSSGVTKPAHKTKGTILDPEVEAALHPEYDPAHQFQLEGIENERAIANELAKRGLEHVPNVNPETGIQRTWQAPGMETPEALTARVPLHYALDRPDGAIVLGRGAEGENRLKKYTSAVARARAAALARQDPEVVRIATDRGINPMQLGSRRVIARNQAPYDARLREAGNASLRISKAGKGAAVDVQRATAQRAAEVAKVAAGLDRTKRALLLGDDALGAALRDSRTIREALASSAGEQREAAKAILNELQTAKAPVPPSPRVVRGAAQDLHAGEMEAQRPFWDALSQVGGKIRPDLVWDTTKKRWVLAGEFADVPKSLLAPMKDVPKGTTGKAAGNIDEVAAIVRKTHPEITDSEVRAFFAEHPRRPRVADFLDDARTRIVQEILPKYRNAGPERIADLQRELRDALARVERTGGAHEGATAAAGPLADAAAKMRSSTELGAAGLDQAKAALGSATAPTGGETAALERIGALDRKQRVTLDALRRAADEVRGKREAATAFQRARDRYYGEVYESVKRSVEKQAVKMPPGYQRESELGLASPSARDMAIDKSFADFFQGAQRLAPHEAESAKAFWRSLQVMNRLSRASIVLMPQVHGVNNLGMHYLAAGAEYGADPVRMAAILAGKVKFSPELEERATQAGAYNEYAVRAFGGALGEADPHVLTTEAGELSREIGAKAGPLAKVATPVVRAGIEAERRVYQPMNRWLFGNAEKGYALDLFERFTKAGMSDGEAAIKIRNTLGKYGDVSPREVAMHLDRLFYFYPWMKTVVPFWVERGMLDPKWWSAPVRAIEVNNQAQGFDDPSKPFTGTFGRRANGDFRRIVLPLPQRVLENVAEAARLPVDVARGDFKRAREDASAPLNYVAGHASLPLSLVIDALQAAGGGGRANLPPYNTFASNPNDPGWKQAAEIGGKIAGRAFAPLGVAGRALEDPAGVSSTYLTGGFAYGTAPAAKRRDVHMVRARYGPLIGEVRKAINAAHENGDGPRELRLRAELQRLVDAEQRATAIVEQRYAARP